MAFLAAWCAAAGILLLAPAGRASRRLVALRGAAPLPVRAGRPVAEAPLLRATVFVGGLVVLSWVVLGPWGIVLGGPAGIALTVWVGRLEPAAAVRAREQISRDLPLALDLLAACSAVGRTPQQALPVVSRAIGGALGARLDDLAARLSLGADPAQEWARLASDPQLGDLGRAVQRCVESGAPLAEGLTRLAEDKRRGRRTETQTRARTVGVKAAGPLALCFLPAFMVVGVVPTVAGSFQHLLG